MNQFARFLQKEAVPRPSAFATRGVAEDPVALARTLLAMGGQV